MHSRPADEHATSLSDHRQGQILTEEGKTIGFLATGKREGDERYGEEEEGGRITARRGGTGTSPSFSHPPSQNKGEGVAEEKETGDPFRRGPPRHSLKRGPMGESISNLPIVRRNDRRKGKEKGEGRGSEQAGAA